MNEHIDNEADLVSKSQRKREADAMQELGEKLTELRPAQRALLPLTDTLISAIEEYNRLPKSFAARSRQLQFIGRLMRETDYTLIASELAKLESPNFVSAKTKQKRASEELAIKLLVQGDAIINEILVKYPSLDRQQLRQLHREYKKSNDTKQTALISRCRVLISNAMQDIS